MSLSNVAFRSAMMASRRAPRFLVSHPTTMAAFSTQTQNQVQQVEEKLNSLNWAHLKDNVHEIRNLMDEPKTNHAIRVPDATLEMQVVEYMKEIQDMIADPAADMDQVQLRVCGLKRMVKDKLYYA